MDKTNDPGSIHVDELAVPEFHTKDFDKIQEEIEDEENRQLNEQPVTNEFVAVPEVHFHRREKKS